MEIKKLCAQLRAVSNLSQFARDSGVSRRTLNRLRLGWNNPTYEVLKRIEDQFKRESK